MMTAEARPATSCGLLTAAVVMSLVACAPPPAPPPPPSAPPAPPRCELLRRGEPPKHVSKEALDNLAAAAREMDTGALVVVDDGNVVLEQGDPQRRFELMSVTKSIVSLLVGQLSDRKVVRLEQPLSDFFPTWKGTPKEPIQIHHVLEHTSGLADARTTEAIYASDDFVQFAVSAELEKPPGKRFFYSNRAVNLLAGVAKRASGKALDAWARAELFEPAGIGDFAWSTDRAGNVQVMAGLQLHAVDLARIGQVVLDGGRVCGKPIVSEDWIRASTGVYQTVGERPHGLLWWLDPESESTGFTARLFQQWKESGVPDEFIDKFRPLEGQFFVGKKDFFRAVDHALTGLTRVPHDKELEPFYQMTWKAGRPDADVKYGPIRAVFADGWGGQVLIVYPKERVVVARLRDVKGPDDAKQKRSFLDVTNEVLWGISGKPKK